MAMSIVSLLPSAFRSNDVYKLQKSCARDPWSSLRQHIDERVVCNVRFGGFGGPTLKPHSDDLNLVIIQGLDAKLQLFKTSFV